MDSLAFARLGLIYLHLLGCVFALHAVLHSDVRIVLGQIRISTLDRVQRQIVVWLWVLWLSGLAIAAIDLEFSLANLALKPKVLTKLLVVFTLTVNGALLGRLVFPRLRSYLPLAPRTVQLTMAAGAVSTASWLFAAFLGVAKPMAKWPFGTLAGLYLGLLALALAAAWQMARHAVRENWRGLGDPVLHWGLLTQTMPLLGDAEDSLMAPLETLPGALAPAEGEPGGGGRAEPPRDPGSSARH